MGEGKGTKERMEEEKETVHIVARDAQWILNGMGPL